MAEVSKKTKAPLGASLIVFSSLFYASYGIWTKLIGDFLDGYTAAAARGLIVISVLLIVATINKKWQPLDLKRNWPYIAGMFTASLFTWGPLYYAILKAGIGISIAINYAGIVMGSFFFGWLLANERFTKDKALSVILGFSGLGIIFSPSINNIGWLALMAAAISGLLGGAITVFAKKISYNATQSTLALWITSMSANLVMALIFSKDWPAFSLQVEWFYLVLFGFASVIASWTFVTGLKLVEAGAAGILGLLEIVFGVIFGVIFFQERPGIIVLLGVIVVIAASAIPYIKDYQAQTGKLE